MSTTVWDASSGGADPGSRTVPIGRPIPNTRMYVLDENLEPVPIGIVGELYVGGAGLARGYRNRPDLTAERFVPDPFRGGGERLYRTGDRVRHRPDGDLEYMSRADEQVKLRGFRVEPGEVEAELRAHPAVQDAAVVLKGRRRSASRGLPGRERPAKRRRPRSFGRFLRKTLPDFMIPSTFVTLGALPLSPNGKVDRQALPEPDSDRPGHEKPYVAPRDVVEVKLARLWEKILDVESVGVQDDFFELGGHSLLAVRLLSQIEQVFGRQLPLAVVFDAPTVGQLASLLRAEAWSPSWQSLVPIQAERLPTAVLLCPRPGRKRPVLQGPGSPPRPRTSLYSPSSPRDWTARRLRTGGSRTWPLTTSGRSGSFSRRARTGWEAIPSVGRSPSRWPGNSGRPARRCRW